MFNISTYYVTLCVCPQWREFAKEMDGVIRIGAVNCGDNNRLCRSKGINSYPSLYIYKAGMVGETSQLSFRIALSCIT